MSLLIETDRCVFVPPVLQSQSPFHAPVLFSCTESLSFCQCRFPHNGPFYLSFFLFTCQCWTHDGKPRNPFSMPVPIKLVTMLSWNNKYVRNNFCCNYVTRCVDLLFLGHRLNWRGYRFFPVVGQASGREINMTKHLPCFSILFLFCFMAAVAMETAALPRAPEAQVGDRSLDVVSDPQSTFTVITLSRLHATSRCCWAWLWM